MSSRSGLIGSNGPVPSSPLARNSMETGGLKPATSAGKQRTSASTAPQAGVVLPGGLPLPGRVDELGARDLDDERSRRDRWPTRHRRDGRANRRHRCRSAGFRRCCGRRSSGSRRRRRGASAGERVGVVGPELFSRALSVASSNVIASAVRSAAGRPGRGCGSFGACRGGRAQDPGQPLACRPGHL